MTKQADDFAVAEVASMVWDGGKPITPEMVDALHAAAADNREYFNTKMSPIMDREIAEQVRKWRVDEEYTWRGVAAMASQKLDEDWGSNQFAGITLCEMAASFFEEDPNKEPWN